MDPQLQMTGRNILIHYAIIRQRVIAVTPWPSDGPSAANDAENIMIRYTAKWKMVVRTLK